MTPFVHAHAGAAPLNHSGLHVHRSLQGDVAYHAVSSDEQGAAVEVAQGMPLRHSAQAMADVEAPAVQPPTAMVGSPRTVLPAPSSLHLAPPDHALPLALAPPLG